jgi:hypothetical protein
MPVKKVFSSFEEMLVDFLPPKALAEACRLLRDVDVFVKIVPPRKTIQGSYRLPTAHRRHFITINNNLNPYTFLITLLHEIAHAQAWTKYKSKNHQKEWKNCFRQLLNHFIQLDVFPNDVQIALERHIEKITYSDVVDINLTKTLRKYDENSVISDSKLVALYEISENTVFSHNGVVFQKKESLRKYIKCKKLINNRMYRCHPLMMVSVVENKNNKPHFNPL